MSSMYRYQLPVKETQWKVDSQNEVTFVWEYEDGSDDLLKLYDKGKQQQWDAKERIDWSLDLDPENPMELPDELIRIYGSPMWDKMTAKERSNLRRHSQAWQISQFLHGEQGALMVAARIVEAVPDINAKFYAATQVMDEARHVEAYSRLLHDKFEIAYPITPPLASLLEDVLHDRRWDVNYLGMQVLIEGLALAAFHGLRDMSKNPLSASVNAYVMQDEARHVAFGRLSLREYYPQLSPPEIAEREDILIEGCWHIATASPLPRCGRPLACRWRNAWHGSRPRKACACSAPACSAASCPSSATSACGRPRYRRRLTKWACWNSATPIWMWTSCWRRTKKWPRSSMPRPMLRKPFRRRHNAKVV